MRCPNCGASILDGASFCERCGIQVGIPPFKSSQLRPQPTKDNKVLWIVAIVVIIMVAVPIILSAVLYFMVLGFDGTSTQTPTSSLTRSTVTGGDKFTFAPMSQDTQWGDVTILLSDWSNTASWSPLTTDLDDGTSAEWVGGSQIVGTLNVFANITDLAGNGYINQGDYVTLTVGGGAFSAATTYTVTILHDPSSAEICHIYFLGEAETTPTSSLTKSTISNGVKFTFAPMSIDTPWGDVTILLSDGSNTASWAPLTTDLDNATTAKWNHLVTTANLGTLKVNISIVDLAGNGYVNQDDYFTLTNGPGTLMQFSSAATYVVTIIHDPSSAEICHIYFLGEAETTPTSALTKSSITNGVMFTFAPMSQDTQWSDVSILLTDGSNTVTWSPLTTDLDNGTVAKWNHITVTANLGTLKVNISILDLAGNGYVNQGDYFTLTLGTGQAFSTVTAYTVTIMHDPSSAEVCHIYFQGGEETTPTTSLTKSTVTGGDKFTFAPMSQDTPWSDVSVLLTDGGNSKTWTLLTTDLDNGTTAKYNLIATVANLGTLKVNISVVDLAGNGYVNQGDYITLTLGTGQAFSNTVTYTITIMHDPSSAAICHLDFQG